MIYKFSSPLPHVQEKEEKRRKQGSKIHLQDAECEIDLRSRIV